MKLQVILVVTISICAVYSNALLPSVDISVGREGGNLLSDVLPSIGLQIGRSEENDSGGDENQGGNQVQIQNQDYMVLQLNEKNNYIITYNKTSSKVGFLDSINNISIGYDGLTGAAFVLLFEEGRGAYLPPGASKLTWNAKTKPFEQYFKNPVPPKQILDDGIKYGLQFNPQLITESLSEKMRDLLVLLSPDYSSQCEALSNAIVATKGTSDRLKTTLSGFFKVMGDVSVQTRGDCNWQVGVHGGLSRFFVPFGGINVLNKKNIQLDFEEIFFKQKTPFHVLGYLLEALSKKFKLGSVLGKDLNSELKFFELIAELGGGVTYGFDGSLCVIADIEKYLAKENSLENLKSILRKFFTNPRVDPDNLGQKWRTSIQDLMETIKQLKLEKSFSQLMKLLENILDDKWNIGRVCMSEVVEIILNVQLPSNEDSVNEVIDKLQNGEECENNSS